MFSYNEILNKFRYAYEEFMGEEPNSEEVQDFINILESYELFDEDDFKAMMNDFNNKQ